MTINIKAICLLALFFFKLPALLHAQASLSPDPLQNLKFEHISLEEGLSQSTIRCIFQDSKGFIWFGTEDGLNRYDGYRFTVYKPDPANPNSLSARVVRSIYEDRTGVLWIGTSGGGLSRMSRDDRKTGMTSAIVALPPLPIFQPVNTLSASKAQTMTACGTKKAPRLKSSSPRLPGGPGGPTRFM